MNTIRYVLFLLTMGLFLIGTNGAVDAMKGHASMKPDASSKAVEYSVTSQSPDTSAFLFKIDQDTSYTPILENTGKEGTICYSIYSYHEGSTKYPLLAKGKVGAGETAKLKRLIGNGTVMIGLNREVKVRQRLNPRWWEALFLPDNELYSCGEGTLTLYKS